MANLNEVHHSLCPPFNMYRLAREKTCVMRGEPVGVPQFWHVQTRPAGRPNNLGSVATG